MDNFRRTGIGGLLQTCAMLGIAVPQIANTTLNEKLSIQANATLGVNEMPRARYICIGIGGHQGTVGADGILLIGSAQHRPTDNSLFRMMPFVMRPLTNDLTTVERQRYALRRIENHKGLDYAVYYPEGEEKKQLISLIANHMKKCFLNWNKDGVEDQKILDDLRDYSKGMINLTPEDLHLNEQQRVYVPRRPQQNNNQRRPQQNNNQRKKY
jgi:hypothetical protein